MVDITRSERIWTWKLRTIKSSKYKHGSFLLELAKASSEKVFCPNRKHKTRRRPFIYVIYTRKIVSFLLLLSQRFSRSDFRPSSGNCRSLDSDKYGIKQSGISLCKLFYKPNISIEAGWKHNSSDQAIWSHYSTIRMRCSNRHNCVIKPWERQYLFTADSAQIHIDLV